jgi:hypothetical protein
MIPKDLFNFYFPVLFGQEMNSLENNILQQTIEEEKLVDPAEAKRQKIL